MKYAHLFFVVVCILITVASLEHFFHLPSPFLFFPTLMVIAVYSTVYDSSAGLTRPYAAQMIVVITLFSLAVFVALSVFLIGKFEYQTPPFLLSTGIAFGLWYSLGRKFGMQELLGIGKKRATLKPVLLRFCV